MPIQPVHLLQLCFTVLQPIRNLPHFHGCQWKGLFKNLRKLAVELSPDLADIPAALYPVPVEMGIRSYTPGDTVMLGLTVPADSSLLLDSVLKNFNNSPPGRGHFQAGVTLKLDSAMSRVTGQPWEISDPPVTPENLENEIEHLSNLATFSLETLSPLRVMRPTGLKEKGHKLFDHDFFFSGEIRDPVRFFLQRLGCADLEAQIPQVTGGALRFLDITYKEKSLGGVVGRLSFSGKPSPDQAKWFVLGQYAGVGKNKNDGEGFYSIPELQGQSLAAPLQRGTTLMSRALETSSLETARDRLPDSSPGPDGMSLADAKAAGTALLEMLRKNTLTCRTVNAELKHYALSKPSGGVRSIHVQNMGERILHRSFADILGKPLDQLFSDSSYAYRKGRSRKNAARILQDAMAAGYEYGIKADIRAFFDSIDLKMIRDLLAGLFPLEPMITHIDGWLQNTSQQGIPGLPQGWCLSPLLSNLFLDRFDRDMEEAGFRLVRFADDFVLLARSSGPEPDIVKTVENSLAGLGLALHPEKTCRVLQGQEIEYLGYLISRDMIRNNKSDEHPIDEKWLPVFKAEWQLGIPVYITSICRGAYSDGANLVVNRVDGAKQNISWNGISRLVVVGRSSFSGGVIHRAVREQIPVTFIDVMGRMRGHLTVPQTAPPKHIDVQRAKQSDKDWVLELSKKLICAKIHNCRILLRRNDRNDEELKTREDQAFTAQSLEELRGIEGRAARVYFRQLATLVDPFDFRGRVYHPPDGPVNVMLSFGYTLLYNRLATALESKGLETRLGFLHAGRGKHQALASDVIEPLRHLIDRIVLSMIHLKEISPADFDQQKRNMEIICRLTGEGFRTFISRYEWVMSSRFTLPDGRKMDYNEYLDTTAGDLRRTVCYDIPYKPLKIY